MENEIKVGEYCRTKNGLIAKLIEPQVYEINDKECIEFLENIVKHSPNPIDIIEKRRLCKWKRSNRNKRMEILKRWLF